MNAAPESTDLVDVLSHIRKRCEFVGSQAEWARQNGFTPAYLHRVLNTESPPSPRMLAIIGLRRVTRFVPMGDADV